MKASGPWHMPRRAAVGGILAAGVSALTWRSSASGADVFVTPEQFGAVGDGRTNDAAAFREACRHCDRTGNHLRLSRRRYRGARLEVHGSFDVLGEGAIIDYLGIGNTLIGGLGLARGATMTAWPATDLDAYADRHPVRMHRLARAANPGARVLELANAAGLRPGDHLFLAQQPTSMSSRTNFIPSNFAFVTIASLAGSRVTLVDPLEIGFDPGAGGFTSSGIAVGCTISDLTIATDQDAYQHVLRSGINIVLERITFAGKSAVGASTFADRVTYRDCRALGSYAPLSVARGCGRILIDGFSFSTRRDPPTAEPYAIYLEESFREVVVRRVKGDGAGFSIRMTDLGDAQRRGRVVVDRCSFRTDNAVLGATGPFQGGVSIGLDIEVRSCEFRGAAVKPENRFFPGVAERALTWMATLGDKDHLIFTDCLFESINGGVAFASGGGFQGRLTLNPAANRFSGCRPPATV